jgi:hypothetical protein
MNFSKLLFAVALTVFLVACAAHRPEPAPRIFVDRSYVDLQPGWRIRVVTPVLKSGGYKVTTEEVKGSDGTVQLRTGADFVGYEVDYYSVEAARAGGVVIRFVSAELRTNGSKRTKKAEPLVPLFTLPVDASYVRLLFLTRVSPTEHDEATLGASSIANLDLLTNKVETNPAENCKTQAEGTCSWIPEGISVQPEKKNVESKAWTPAV